jgi:hypothetical protein
MWPAAVADRVWRSARTKEHSVIRQFRSVNLLVLGALVLGLFVAAVGSASAATSQDFEDGGGGDFSGGEVLTIAEEDAIEAQMRYYAPRIEYCSWLAGRIIDHYNRGNTTRVEQLDVRYGKYRCDDAVGYWFDFV